MAGVGRGRTPAVNLPEYVPSDEVVSREQLRGDLHCHTIYSDGTSGIEAMALEASRLGHEYLAVTDHAMSSHVRSLDASSLQIQAREIAELNSRFEGKLTILQGAELDIGPKGGLADLGEWIDRLDLVIASIHTDFEMPRDEMTARVLSAVSIPQVKILGHPTARRIGSRDAVDFDLDAVFEAAAANGVALEINSTPTRLDLNEQNVARAREFGCMFSIDTDSHGPSRLQRIALGLEIAQSAALPAADVINCLPLQALRMYLGSGSG